MQVSKTTIRKKTSKELIKSVWAKLDAHSPEQKENIYKALAIDPEHLVARSEHQF
jgi:hypothetical protein